MRILFDHGTPAPLQTFLAGHPVQDAKAQLKAALSKGPVIIQ